jgi:hypothetical protein
MAMACLRLFTVPPFPPFPDFSVPRFSRCIALFTLLPAALPYLRPPDLLRELAAILSLLLTRNVGSDEIECSRSERGSVSVESCRAHTEFL